MRRKNSLQMAVKLQPQRTSEYKYVGNKINKGSSLLMREDSKKQVDNKGGCGCNNNPKQLGYPVKKYLKKSF